MNLLEDIITSKYSFSLYEVPLKKFLRYEFNFLANIKSLNPKKFQSKTLISFTNIQNYFDFPMIFTQALFNSLDTNKQGTINIDDYIEGFLTIYTGNISKRIDFVFNMFNFNNDNLMHYEDVKHVLTYCHYYYNQTKIDILLEIITNFFKDKNIYTKAEFSYEIYHKNSDIFFIVLTILFEKKSFTVELLNCLNKEIIVNSHINNKYYSSTDKGISKINFGIINIFPIKEKNLSSNKESSEIFNEISKNNPNNLNNGKLPTFNCSEYILSNFNKNLHDNALFCSPKNKSYKKNIYKFSKNYESFNHFHHNTNNIKAFYMNDSFNQLNFFSNNSIASIPSDSKDLENNDDDDNNNNKDNKDNNESLNEEEDDDFKELMCFENEFINLKKRLYDVKIDMTNNKNNKNNKNNFTNNFNKNNFTNNFINHFNKNFKNINNNENSKIDYDSNFIINKHLDMRSNISSDISICSSQNMHLKSLSPTLHHRHKLKNGFSFINNKNQSGSSSFYRRASRENDNISNKSFNLCSAINKENTNISSINEDYEEDIYLLSSNGSIKKYTLCLSSKFNFILILRKKEIKKDNSPNSKISNNSNMNNYSIKYIIPLRKLYIKKVKENCVIGDDVYILVSLENTSNYTKMSYSFLFDKSDKNNYEKFSKLLVHLTNYTKIQDDYKSIKKIGKGRFGAMYLMKSVKNNNLYAVKKIKKSWKNKEEYDSLNWEKDIEIFISHYPNCKNICKCYEIKETLEHIYIIMEYVKKGSLFNYIFNQEKNISPSTVYEMIKQINSGLYELHNNGIIHRDLKLENILVNYNLDPNKFTLKIIDFGLSKVITPLSKTNEPYGTLLYCSPEILFGNRHNFKTDIWSMGVVSYYLMFTSYPFTITGMESVKEMLNKVYYKQLTLPNNINDIVKNNNNNDIKDLKNEKNKYEYIKKLITMCLNKDIKIRPTCYDIINFFNDINGNSSCE